MRRRSGSRLKSGAETKAARVWLLVLVAGWIGTACDSGSGGGAESPNAGPSQSIALSSTEQSARFLAQATLGANMEEIERVDRLGFPVWIDEQIALPWTSHLDAMNRLQFRYGSPLNNDTNASPLFRRFAWWDQVMRSPDLLRQRVAMALSEIFVISERMDLLNLNPAAVASYYDILLKNAFGSYETLLNDVSLHPAMGTYLSHLNNDRSDASIGRFPDENYAREVMQLFSIGLFELNSDGTQRKNGRGEPIPTYGNTEIMEFAKIFTGLGMQGPAAAFGSVVGDSTLPMIVYEAHHEPGPKVLLNGFTVPDGQSGMEDIEDALGHLSDHPNVGPFLATRLIQRLVRSNPSPGYVQRVARVFDDDGSGTRGNLGAVVRAILLDDEARRDPRDEEDGFLREPFLRWVSMLRTFDAASTSGEYLVDGSFVGFVIQQHPMASPSVFNFFSPDFAPNGAIKEAGLVAPEFQITSDDSVIWLANLATFFLFDNAAQVASVDDLREGSIEQEDIAIFLDLSDEEALSQDVDALIDRLDLLLTYGSLSEETRSILETALLDPAIAPAVRPRLAIHLILISPDYAVVN